MCGRSECGGVRNSRKIRRFQRRHHVVCSKAKMNAGKFWVASIPNAASPRCTRCLRNIRGSRRVQKQHAAPMICIRMGNANLVQGASIGNEVRRQEVANSFFTVTTSAQLRIVWGALKVRTNLPRTDSGMIDHSPINRNFPSEGTQSHCDASFLIVQLLRARLRCNDESHHARSSSGRHNAILALMLAQRCL
jgi:hypothetical protein